MLVTRKPHQMERVRDGEVVFHLQEFDEFEDGVLTRWQEIAARHKGKPCLHYEALGPSEKFTSGPIKILASVYTDNKIVPAGDTAGDLREHANRFRESGFMEEMIEERRETSTLIEDYHTIKDMERVLGKRFARTIHNMKEYASGV